jgi:hypothetical protein
LLAEGQFPSLVCVDHEDIIYDDGSALTAPWVGRPLAELEARLPAGGVLKVMVGVDPLVVLGLKDADEGA